jgi:hypothetical protein
MTVGIFPFLTRLFRRSGRAKAGTTVASTHDDPDQRRRISRGLPLEAGHLAPDLIIDSVCLCPIWA